MYAWVLSGTAVRARTPCSHTPYVCTRADTMHSINVKRTRCCCGIVARCLLQFAQQHRSCLSTFFRAFPCLPPSSCLQHPPRRSCLSPHQAPPAGPRPRLQWQCSCPRCPVRSMLWHPPLPVEQFRSRLPERLFLQFPRRRCWKPRPLLFRIRRGRFSQRFQPVQMDIH